MIIILAYPIQQQWDGNVEAHADQKTAYIYFACCLLPVWGMYHYSAAFQYAYNVYALYLHAGKYVHSINLPLAPASLTILHTTVESPAHCACRSSMSLTSTATNGHYSIFAGWFAL